MKLKLLLITTVAMLFASSCKKDSKNPLYDSLGKVGSYLSITETVNLNVDFAVSTSTASIKVKQVGADIDKIDLFVVKGSSLDVSTWAFIKTVPYSGEGTELSVSNAEIAAAIGEALAPGEQYTVYTRVTTKAGDVYDLVNAGPAVESPDFYSAFEFTVSAVAPYTGNMAGDYTVVRDDWADYSVGNVIAAAIEDGPGANQITMHVYPNPDYGIAINPIIIDIDPATGVASVPEVEYSNYGSVSSPLNYSCTGYGTDGLAGYVFSATGIIDLTLKHFTTGRDPSTVTSTYRLVISKN